MKFFLDANLPTTLLATLEAAYPSHQYDSAHSHGLEAEEDESLLNQAGELGAQVFITSDLRQMRRPKQRSACRDAALHWVGLHQPSIGVTGITVIASLTAPLLNAFPILIDDMAAASVPTSYTLKGSLRQRTQILASTSPV